MCSPLIAMAAMAAVSAYQQSATQKAQANYQSQVAANNQKVAEYQALDAKARGDMAVADTHRKYAALQGTQAATLAARGLDIGEGSANAILTDTDFFGAYDERITRSNAEREAWKYRAQASNFQGDSAAFRASANAQNPLLSGVLAGASSYFGGGGMLSSGGSVSSRWYN